MLKFDCVDCNETLIIEADKDDILTEEAVYTCPVCGTKAQISAELVEPVMQSGGGGGAGLAPPPAGPAPTNMPAPPSPPSPPEIPEPELTASLSDEDLTKALVEIKQGKAPKEVILNLMPETAIAFETFDPPKPNIPDIEDFADDYTYDEKANNLINRAIGDTRNPLTEKTYDTMPDDWEGSLATFNTKFQALMKDEDLNASGLDVGKAVAELQSSKALKVDGDKVKIDLPKMVTALANYIEDEREPDEEENGIVPALPPPPDMGMSEPTEPMSGPAPMGKAGPPDEFGEPEASPDEFGEPEIPPKGKGFADVGDAGAEPAPEPPSSDWEEKIKDCLPKYF